MPLSKEAQQAVGKTLSAEQEIIERELADLGVSSDGSVRVSFDEGFADAAQTTSERARVLSMAEGLQQRLEEVRAALQRVERGTYGRCENCGNEINPERLEAIPTARLCITCKQKLS